MHLREEPLAPMDSAINFTPGKCLVVFISLLFQEILRVRYLGDPVDRT